MSVDVVADDRWETLAAPWPQLFAWIEEVTGGRICRQIELIDPGIRGFRVQPINWSAVPTT